MTSFIGICPGEKSCVREIQKMSNGAYYWYCLTCGGKSMIEQPLQFKQLEYKESGKTSQ